MKNKSYDYIFGNGKFNTWFNIIVSIISCSAISFCLTELLFSFDFKVSFQKALIFTILFVIFLLLFYYLKGYLVGLSLHYPYLKLPPRKRSHH